MIKVVVLLRRSESWTRERFHRWWLDEHVPYAKKLPALRKYRVCLVTGSTTHEGKEPWDGIAELWFDNRAALDAAWSSEVGDRKSTRLNSSHSQISYAVFCLKKKKIIMHSTSPCSISLVSFALRIR